MEQMAMPGTIVLAPATLQLAEGYVQVVARGPVAIKGLRDPIEVYELTGASASRSRLQAAAARGLTKLVGRSAELAQLAHALERAHAGHGHVVAIVGEAGVGKSRLAWEFTHGHRTQGWLIVESTSVSYGKATAFLPLIDLLRAYFQIETRDEARKVREKVTGKLLSLDRALEPSLAAFLWFLDVPVDDPQWERLDPSQRRQQMLEGIKRLLLRESQVQPLLILFEDLHWIDAETQALLDSLVESLPTARLLLLVNYRPEYQHAWAGKTYYRQILIAPLPPESAEELLDALLGRESSLQPLKRMLIERTEGNPFFLEESVRTLVETKILSGERGTYRLLKPSQGLQIPATAQAILAARIDRLAPEDKQLLQAASVIGKDVPFALLQAIAEGPEETLRLSLTRLQSSEFLYEARLFPDLEYTFKHALIAEVAYGSLLHDRRRALHGRILHTIETLYPARLIEHVERLAHHACLGEVWDKAVIYLRQAGSKASAHSAYRDAVLSFERALEALSHLRQNRETLEQVIDLRFDLRGSLFPLGQLKAIVNNLQEAERLAKILDDQRRIAWASVYLSECSRLTGDLTSARRFAQTACTIAETLNEFPLQTAANFYLGTSYVSSGDSRSAADLFRRIAHRLDGALIRERCRLAGFPAVMSRAYLAWALAELGEFDEGTSCGAEGLRIAEAFDHPFSLALAYWGLAHLHTIRGEHDRGIALAERGLALCRDWSLSMVSPVLTRLTGYARAVSGRAVEGAAILRQAVTAHEAAGRYVAPRVLGELGEALLLAEQLGDVDKFAARALALARERGSREAEAWVLRLIAEIASRPERHDIETAESHYHRARAVADELGMRPLVAHCHLGLGKLSRRLGKREQAQEHLTTATTMYREMGMQFWLEKTEKELGELR